MVPSLAPVPQPPPRRRRGLRPPAPALGGGADLRLAGPVAPPVQGLRALARVERSHDPGEFDPSDATPPYPRKTKALAKVSLCSLRRSLTGSQRQQLRPLYRRTHNAFVRRSWKPGLRGREG